MGIGATPGNKSPLEGGGSAGVCALGFEMRGFGVPEGRDDFAVAAWAPHKFILCETGGWLAGSLEHQIPHGDDNSLGFLLFAGVSGRTCHKQPQISLLAVVCPDVGYRGRAGVG